MVRRMRGPKRQPEDGPRIRHVCATGPPWRLALALLIVLVPGAGRADGDDPGRFFRLGPQSIGLTLGYGHGASITSTGRFEGKRVRELVIVANWQIALTRPPIRPAWYKGILALRIEPSVIVNFEPRTGAAGGAAAMLRYELTRWGGTRPFLEGGAGIIGLDFDLFDQADGLAFNPTAGLGVSHRLGSRWSVELSCRFQHISNAFTKEPNGGIEAFQYLAGASYRF